MKRNTCIGGDSDPVDKIKQLMEERGMKGRDLLPVFGTTARLSEVLNRKRRLSIDHIRALHFNFGMDASDLLRKY